MQPMRTFGVLCLFTNVLVALGSLEGSPQMLPVYLREPRDVYIVPGKRPTLSCQVGLLAIASKQFVRLKDSQRVSISWLFNGSSIASTRLKDYVITSGNDASNLTIANIRPLSASFGRYQCVANFSFGSILSKPAFVRAAIATPAAEQASLQNNTVTMTVGNTAFISCSSPFDVSVPKAEVVGFELNGAPLTLTSRHFVTTDGNLLIAAVQQTDQGSYRCKMANPAMNNTRFSPNFNVLRVTDPKKDKDGPAPRHVVQRIPQPDIRPIVGQNVTIECVFVGMPPPRTVWEFARVGESQRPVTQTADGRIAILSGALQISNVQPEDAGVYSCSSIDSRSIPHYSHVWVSKPPMSQLESNQLITLRLGTKLELDCAVTDATSFTWHHDGMVLSGVATSKLVINPVTMQHAGLYQCFGENAFGSASMTVRVNVVSFRMPLQIVDQPVNLSVSVDELAVFVCVSNSYANGKENERSVTWSWLKDGRAIPVDDVRFITELHNDQSSSLQIYTVKPSDAGSYTCVLSENSSSRSMRATAWLTVESTGTEEMSTKPPTRKPKRRPTTASIAESSFSVPESSRTQLYIAVVNSTSLLLRWTHAETVVRWLDGTAVWYRVNASDAQTQTKFVTAEVNEYILDSLQPDTWYEVWVVAQQQNGDRAAPSQSVFVRTQPTPQEYLDELESDYAPSYEEDQDGRTMDIAIDELIPESPSDALPSRSQSLTVVPTVLPGALRDLLLVTTLSVATNDRSPQNVTDSTLFAVLVSAACGTLLLLGVIVALLLTRSRRYRRTKSDGTDSPSLRARSIDRSITSYAKLPQQTATVNISPNRVTGPVSFANVDPHAHALAHAHAHVPPDDAYVLQSTLSRNMNRLEAYPYAADEQLEAVAYASAPIFVPSLVTKRGSLVLQSSADSASSSANANGNQTKHLLDNPYPYTNATPAGGVNLYHTLLPPQVQVPPPQVQSPAPVQPCNIVSFLSNIRPPSVTNSTVSSQWHATNVNALPRTSVGQLTAAALIGTGAGAGAGTGTVSGSSRSPSLSSVQSTSDCDCSQDESNCRRSGPKSKSPRLEGGRGPSQAFSTAIVGASANTTASRKRKHAKYRNGSASGRKNENASEFSLTLTHSVLNNGALATHLNLA